MKTAQKAAVWAALVGVAGIVGTSVAPTAVNAQVPAARYRRVRGEKHPEIRQAMHNLEQARTNLQRADRDFDGHRAKAVSLTNQALEECRRALAADR